MKWVQTTLFFVLISTSLFGSLVEERLSHIPRSEREKMESFFDFSIKLGHSGHVLYFENKPVSLFGIWHSVDSNKEFREGWFTFKKYENLFPHPNFIFNEKSVVLPSGVVTRIFLINKKVFVDCVNRHSCLFQETLGRQVEGYNLLQEIENGAKLIDLIQGSDVLLGVLLGYGEESSKLFNEKHKQGVKGVGNYETVTPIEDESIEIFPVAFKGNPNSINTKKIVSTYEGERKLLWDSYLEKGKDSTLFFLEQFCR